LFALYQGKGKKEARMAGNFQNDERKSENIAEVGVGVAMYRCSA
jgi:hypothetical protein